MRVLPLLLFLAPHAAANGCYDMCCFAPSCPHAVAASAHSSVNATPLKCPAGHTRKMQSCAAPCCVPNAGTSGSCCQLGHPPGPKPGPGQLAIPTEVQLEWQDLEVGALNSFQMVTFWGGQLSASRPFNISDPKEFDPTDMDTDQWAEAVVAMGGKYQVLNVKDESGFLLWPSECKYSNGTVYPYSVRSAPNKEKNGDLLERFVASNTKHGVRSGIYYLGWGNFFMNITNDNGYDCSRDTPQTREFMAMQLCQLEELYVRYNFSEVWFDGGAPCLDSYEQAIANLTTFYQGKRAVAFQGPKSYPNDVRWVGTEAGVAPVDTWSATASSQAYGAGARDGAVWAPAESDTCIRTADCCAPGGEPADSGSSGCWVWYPNTTQTVKSLATLASSYLETVGRNANLLLNISPNTDGTIDAVDMSAYTQLGAWVKKSFGTVVKQLTDVVLPCSATSPTCSTVLDLAAATDTTTSTNISAGVAAGGLLNFSYVSIMEDQHAGQKIWGWSLEGRKHQQPTNNASSSSAGATSASSAAEESEWIPLAHGQSIGHKRLISCADISAPPSAPLPGAGGADGGEQGAVARDPPAPAPKPSDVLFVECSRAHGWTITPTAATAGSAATGSAATPTAVRIRSTGLGKDHSAAADSLCLTLDGPATRFQFISALPCATEAKVAEAAVAAAPLGGSVPKQQQEWVYPWKAQSPNIGFFPQHDDTSSGAQGGDAAAAAVGGTDMCLQINGDHPWTNNRAIVWDCQAGATDEAVKLLPVLNGSAAHLLQIDMSADGGGPLCMAVRANLPPPPPPPSCAGIDALRFTVTQTATQEPIGLRQLGVY